MQEFDPLAMVIKQLPVFKHTFTHYHLHIRPVVINCPSSSAEFRLIDQIELGMPKPVSKILSQISSLTHIGLSRQID